MSMSESAFRRATAGPETEILVVSGGRRTLDAIVEATAQFVRDNSEGGKVGRAFAAALFDILFAPDQVRMRNSNAPSATIPGDVQVGSDGTLWLWAEVKQEAVVTSEIQDFVDRVKSIGGDRAVYFALGNSSNPQNIDFAQLQKRAVKDGLDLTVFTTLEHAISFSLAGVAGSAGMQAQQLGSRMLRRLHEAQVTSALEGKWIELMERAGSQQSTVSCRGLLTR